MHDPGRLPLPLAGFRVLDLTRFLAGRTPRWSSPTWARDDLGITGAELAELTGDGVAYDKHPEAGQ